MRSRFSDSSNDGLVLFVFVAAVDSFGGGFGQNQAVWWMSDGPQRHRVHYGIGYGCVYGQGKRIRQFNSSPYSPRLRTAAMIELEGWNKSG